MRPFTLLELVQKLQYRVHSEDEVIAVVTHLINTGRAVLAGNFAGQRIPEIIGNPPPCPALILTLAAELAPCGGGI